MGKLSNITIDKIKYLYFTKGLSQVEVGRELGISDVSVRTLFRKYSLKARSSADWTAKYDKENFRGDSIEKAYMLGFRAGDLNVYKPKGKSSIIVARTNTTCNEQIVVMQMLFDQYGGVKVSNNSKSKNVTCYLNDSFAFLLEKPYEPEQWLELVEDYGASFIAGYVDAEGSFVINQGRARFKLDAYDHHILKWMHQWFINRGINSKLRQISKKGQPRTGGGVWNGDLWRVNVNEAESLYKVCILLTRLSWHSKRMRDMTKCLDNIQLRRQLGTV